MTPCAPTTWKKLLEKAGQLPQEAMLLSEATDESKRLRRTFDPAFPFEIHSFCFPDHKENLGTDWLNLHDYLELIIPSSGSGRFCMGDHEVQFEPGDLLIVETMKLHGVTETQGEHESIVIFFMPEFVFHPGSVLCDYEFLSPFFGRQGGESPILRRDDPSAAGVHQALIDLLDAYQKNFDASTCKLRLLGVLNELRLSLGATAFTEVQYNQRQRSVDTIVPVIDHLREHFSESQSLPELASMAGMSPTLFKSRFKAVTGSTFTQYRSHLRISAAAHLLLESDLSIGEVAHSVGFSDQSYFDRRFRERFRKTPREYRMNGAVRQPAEAV